MQHPDEGTIHAWLDGALRPAEASVLEAHVAACTECSAAVAEARGMLAGASRILSALDDVPGGVIPAAPADATRVAPGRGRAAAARPFRFRAARWQVAAGLMIAVAGSWLVLRNDGARDMIEIKAADSSGAEQASVAFSADTLPAAERAPVAGGAPAARPGRRTETGATASAGTALATGSGSGTGGAVGDVAATLRGVELSSGTSVPGYAQAGRATRATFDSLLAIDSAQTARGALQLGENVVIAEGRGRAAGAAKTRSAAPSLASPPAAASASPAPTATADMTVGALRQESVPVPVAVAAAGCYALDAMRWSPPAADSVVQWVLPQRIVLDRPSGSPADSGGPWVARPVSLDGVAAPDASGSWSLLGTDQLRVRFDRDERRAVLTLARFIGGWRGVARLSVGADGPIARGDVVARRVACGPPGQER